jgi:mannose-6-phosphate isomerase-like protein (cupin superfamily)
MRLEGYVEKGWGHEYIWVTNEDYCSKYLHFDTGGECSMHFHKDKREHWYVLSGNFEVHWINTKDASIYVESLEEGDAWENAPLVPHKIICKVEGTILEVSTADTVEDNYRVVKGQSQE